MSLLANAVPSERVHLAHRCVGVEQDGKSVRVKFENGTEIEADVLIAADGIFSAVRRALHRTEASALRVPRLSWAHSRGKGAPTFRRSRPPCSARAGTSSTTTSRLAGC